MSCLVICLSFILTSSNSGAAVPRRGVLQLLAGVLATRGTPKSSIPAVVAEAPTLPLEVAHRGYRATQISNLYGLYDTSERALHSIFFVLEDHPDRFGAKPHEVARIRQAMLTAIENNDQDFNPIRMFEDLDIMNGLGRVRDGYRHGGLPFFEEWSPDRNLAVLDLEDSLALTFRATAPEVQHAIDWIMNPSGMMDFAFSDHAFASGPIYSEEFRRAFLVGLAKISPPLAFRMMTNKDDRGLWNLNSVADHKLQVMPTPYNILPYAFFRPPHGRSFDPEHLKLALLDVLSRLERAQTRVGSLAASELKDYVVRQVSERLTVMKAFLKTLPQRLEARMIGVSEHWDADDDRWNHYETICAKQRAEHGLTGPVMSAAEWIRVINATALALGHVTPVFAEEPETVEAVETAAASEVEAPCEPALLEYAPVVDPLELPESQFQVQSH